MRRLFILCLAITAALFSSCKREGCMNKAAKNYDPKAKESCGCCEFEAKVVFWYDQDTRDVFESMGVTSLTVKLNNTVMATSPLFAATVSAPACDSGGTTATLRLGNSRATFSIFVVEDQDGDVLFSEFVEVYPGQCVSVQMM
jgi:hypothetical protein